ncbi:MAG TPA: tetratricopeptide repeat protein [Planctomycetota bacterium]|nr:tetratricopeptide repeat protein [Planctomycetota bacterium]
MAQAPARNLSRVLLAALLLSVISFELPADVIHLKNGKTLHGEVIKEDNESITIKVPFGEVKLKRSEIQAIERQTSTEYRLGLGRDLLQQRNYDRAVSTLEEAFIADRTNPEARRVLAGAYETQGKHLRALHRFAEARETFEKLLKVDPNAELVPHKATDILKELNEKQSSVEEMAKKARRLAAAQEWDKALKAYEDVLAFTPDARSLISGEMARCYVNRAAESSQSGQALNAAADLEAALKLDPTLADRLEKFYTSCALPVILNNLAAGNIKAAEVDLKRVLSFAPTNKTVLYVAGRLEEAMNRLPGAAEYYARALHTRVGNPTAEFTAGLRQKLEKEIGIEGNRWKIDTEIARADEYAESSDGAAQKLEGENFEIYHYNITLARQVLEAAEYHRTRIQTELKLPQLWKGRAKIYIHRTQAEYTARTAQPEWTGGYSKFNIENGSLADPQVHSWQRSPRLLKSVLPHEITHLCVASNVQDFQALPRCLHEGFAVLMEPQFRKDYFMNFLRIRLRSQDFIPLQDLLSSRDYPKDPEFFYAEGYAILEYLVSLKGLPAASGLMKAANAAQVQAEILKLSGARSIEALEDDWRKWILGGK